MDSELRLRNWVYQGNSNILTRVGSLIHGVSGNYKPIPLTEEWLIKFGFESDPYQDRYILVTDNGEFIIHCDKTKGYLDLWLDLSKRVVTVKYVHKLQNLFYELGEELTIKE